MFYLLVGIVVTLGLGLSLIILCNKHDDHQCSLGNHTPCDFEGATICRNCGDDIK